MPDRRHNRQRTSGHGLVITRDGPSYTADIVIDGRWVHLSGCRFRHAAGGVATNDKSLASWVVREIRWIEIDDLEMEP